MPPPLRGRGARAIGGDEVGADPFVETNEGMPKEKILITVKTYPTLSQKYGETVCTAGVRPDGSWIRLYPIPFRRLDEQQQYSKFDWIEGDLVKSRSDPRPETYHPADVKK